MGTEHFGAVTARRRYLKTSEAADYIGYSTDWIKGRMGTIFIEGTHYHRPPGTTRVSWDRFALDRWISGEQADPRAEEILEKMVSY